MKYCKLKYLFIIFTIACIAFIWYHSSLDGNESSLESQEAMLIIKNIFQFLGIPNNISEYALRKMAHFLEFSGLGFLLTMDIYLWNRSYSLLKNIYLSPFIGIVTACIDETIQIFSPGRSSKVTDIWVDFSGIIAATIVTLILIKIFLNFKGTSK